MSWLIYVCIIYRSCPLSLRIVLFSGINYMVVFPKTLGETGDFVSRDRTEGRHKNLHHLPEAALCSVGTPGTAQSGCLDNWRENKEASRSDF